MSLDDPVVLERELRYFHKCLFQREPPPSLIKLYHDVHHDRADLFEASGNEAADVLKIVTKELDAVGIEPWLRFQTQRHLLSRKILLVMYLAETGGRHQMNFMFEERPSLIRTWWHIAKNSLSGVFHLVKGFIQARIYGFS